MRWRHVCTRLRAACGTGGCGAVGKLLQEFYAELRSAKRCSSGWAGTMVQREKQDDQLVKTNKNEEHLNMNTGRF